LVDVQQTKHIVGPAAYAALALALHHNNPDIAEGEIRRAIGHVPLEVCEILLQMPAREPGTNRLDRILYELDQGIRAQALSKNA
jgi:hypothetical protein